MQGFELNFFLALLSHFRPIL